MMNINFRFFKKLPFSKQSHHEHSLSFLNITQFLGVLNDNIFKLIVVFLLIDLLGQNRASSILWKVGVIYVIPFLLFSSIAGILADRFSKQRLLVFMKAAEIVVMALSFIAFALKSQWASFTLLFLLSSHSALFGPSKYGIIPEIVAKDQIGRANGLITSSTYLAIIIGTFLASFLTEITNHHFIYIAGICLLFAIVGFFTALKISPTLPQGSKKQINFFFIREIFQTLRSSRQLKHLPTVIFSAAYFLFIGAFTQLNIIPFAIEALHLNEVDGGYLFLVTALGITAGAYLTGKFSKKKIELAFSCISLFIISFLFMLFACFSSSLFFTIGALLLIGIFGGSFIIPLDSFIQSFSPDQKRGQTIAAGNFLSFCGVFLASIALYFFSEVANLSAAIGFFVIGLISLFIAVFLFLRLSDQVISYLSRKYLKMFYKMDVQNLEILEKGSFSLLVLKNATLFKAFCLSSKLPNVRFFIPKGKKNCVLSLFYSYRHFDIQKPIVPKEIIESIEKEEIACICLEDDTFEINLSPSFSIKNLFNKASDKPLYVEIEPFRKERKLKIVFSQQN